MTSTDQSPPKQCRQVRIIFVPLMWQGHMIPMIDMAKLFSRRPGVAVSIVTTADFSPHVRLAIDHANNAASSPISTLVLQAQPTPSSSAAGFFAAIHSLQKPLDDLLRAHSPDCIVSDSMYMWTADTAHALGIPRLVFYGPSILHHCVMDALREDPCATARAGHSEYYYSSVLEDLIETSTRKSRGGSAVSSAQFLQVLGTAEQKSYGVLVNSFYELEPEYAELHRRKPYKRRAWYVGPVCLVDKDDERSAAVRGGQSLAPQVSGGSLLKWLDQEAARSVVYVCFGTVSSLVPEQLREIAVGLEGSAHPFVWAVGGGGSGSTAGSDWLPEGFEERTEGKGVIVMGWVPQTLILNHPAVGGFLTHCGWNSTVESISAGVPMATLPLAHDQFSNERLVTQVLGVGASAVAPQGKEIAKAVRKVMGSEGAEMRRRAREYAVKAREALQEGGSSSVDITRLIDEIRNYQASS